MRLTELTVGAALLAAGAVVATVAPDIASIAIAFGAFIYIFLSKRKLRIDPESSVVVVTGCDSGFGQMVAIKLAQEKYLVVAGCLTAEGAQRLRQLEPSVAVTVNCDVTKQSDIDKLCSAVEELIRSDDTRRLWAVVNNAGIAPMGHVDWISMNSCRKVMDVNYFGLFAVTKQFLPLLKRTRGSRIINVSSAAGFSGLPNMGIYCASKHAVEGLGKCLRQELAPWGVHVCHINPGFMRTPLIQASVDAAMKEFDDAPSEITSQYDFRNMQVMQDRIVEPMQEEPQVVVDAIVENITTAAPTFMNAVGYQAPLSWAMISYLPQSLISAMQIASNRALGIGPKPEAVREYQNERTAK